MAVVIPVHRVPILGQSVGKRLDAAGEVAVPEHLVKGVEFWKVSVSVSDEQLDLES